MRQTWTRLLVLVAILTIALMGCSKRPVEPQQNPTNHIYASWETMEYDKCVAVWVIKRFVDKEAEFIFYPKETDIQDGIVFDVPGATWSRQHRKCTSDCIMETIQSDDIVLKKIVKMAHCSVPASNGTVRSG